MTLSSTRPKRNPVSSIGSRRSLREGSRSGSSQNHESRNLTTVPTLNQFSSTDQDGIKSYGQKQDQNLDLPKQLPVSIQKLLVTKQVARLIALSLVAGVFYIYSSIVVTNNQWNAERQKLEKLQRQYSEMVAAGESLNYSLMNGIQNSSQNKSGAYFREKPSQVLFLPPINTDISPIKNPSKSLSDETSRDQPLNEAKVNESKATDTLTSAQVLQSPANSSSIKPSNPDFSARNSFSNESLAY